MRIISEEQEESFEDSRTGWFSSMGKGATKGSMAGVAGLLCGPVGGVICIPVLASAGATGGSVYGLYQASSETLPTEVELSLRGAIADVGLANLIVTDLVNYAYRYGYDLKTFSEPSLSSGQMKNNETSRDLGTFDSLLEIEGPVVNLLPTDFIVDPPRRLILSANLRLRLMADQSVLDEQFGIEVRGASYSLRGWTVNQAQNFRKELRLASQRFSEKILHDYFIPYHFSERTFDESGTEYRLKGLKPLSVRESTHVPYLLVKTLRPTLQWERFPVENATYDLKVWKLLDVTEDIRELVYERKGLTQNIHTLESSLVRSTTYIWTVRARFLNDGKLRITDWSKYRKNPSWFRKIWSVASFPPMIDPHFPDWEFYYIRTEAGHVGK